jgi:hypothetical protein
MMTTQDRVKKRDLKADLAFEASFFMERLKETVIDAIGIGWIFEDGLSKIWSVISCLVLLYVRWWIKLAIFIYGALFITALVFPHSSSAH